MIIHIIEMSDRWGWKFQVNGAWCGCATSTSTSRTELERQARAHVAQLARPVPKIQFSPQ